MKSETEFLWSDAFWNEFELTTRQKALSAKNGKQAWKTIVRACRKVMRSYTTSFYIVSRFLPPLKRSKVEIIYASVRYPDEVVDTFPLTPAECDIRLDLYEEAYELGLDCDTLQEALEKGVPAFIAAFTRVVLENEIPPEHYHSFLSAMRHDIRPGTFATLEDLINSYIYGSAIVVGYFLAYVYGPSDTSQMEDVLACSRDLGIALQLTNFLRDVKEDHRRGRLYLPLDMLESEGIRVRNSGDLGDPKEPSNHRKIIRVIRRMSEKADSHYLKSAQRLDVFSPDCRTAIRACIDVYGKLNRQIASSPDCIGRRESVPAREKFSALPASKYWRLPLAMLGR
jgi:phytoene synthase